MLGLPSWSVVRQRCPSGGCACTPHCPCECCVMSASPLDLEPSVYLRVLDPCVFVIPGKMVSFEKQVALMVPGTCMIARVEKQTQSFVRSILDRMAGRSDQEKTAEIRALPRLRGYATVIRLAKGFSRIYRQRVRTNLGMHRVAARSAWSIASEADRCSPHVSARVVRVSALFPW